MDVPRRDPNAAAAVRVPAFTRGDDSGTIGANQPGPASGKDAFDLDHINHRNPFGDTNHQVEPGISRFQDCVGGKRGRHEDDRDGSLGFGDRLPDGIEYWHLIFEDLTTLAW